MRVLDLFCGAAGGWSLGLHRAGFETVAACEIDPWRRAEFSRKFPHARMYDDVRTVTADRLRADGAFPDIVVGSPPCQDASAANHRGLGLDGERTGLFFEWLRLVGECRPRWACAENVPGIRLRGIDRIIEGLEALGYAVWPLVVGADDVGANHRRDRVWIIAHAADADVRRDGSEQARQLRPGRFRMGAGAPAECPRGAIADAHGQGQHAVAGDAEAMGRLAGAAILARCHAADADEARLAIGQGFAGDDGTKRPAAERDGDRPWAHWNGGPPGLDRMDDGLPAGLDFRSAQAAYGDAVVPQIPELIGRAILTAQVPA